MLCFLWRTKQQTCIGYTCCRTLLASCYEKNTKILPPKTISWSRLISSVCLFCWPSLSAMFWWCTDPGKDGSDMAVCRVLVSRSLLLWRLSAVQAITHTVSLSHSRSLDLSIARSFLLSFNLSFTFASYRAHAGCLPDRSRSPLIQSVFHTAHTFVLLLDFPTL